MILDLKHSFSQEDALQRVQKLMAYWHAKHAVAVRWEGPIAHIKGKVRGIAFEGQVSINAHDLHGDLKTSFLAEKLGGRSYVEHKLQMYLDPGTTLDTLP